MNNDQYRRQMGMDMIREEQRLHDLRPRNAMVAVKPAQGKQNPHIGSSFDDFVKSEGWDLRPRIDVARMQRAIEGPCITMPAGLTREEKRQFILRHADDSEFVTGLGW